MIGDAGLQRQLTLIALHALEGRGFALAGSGAIREHGIIDRYTDDVDLFTNEMDPSAFESAIDALESHLRSAGFHVDEVRRAAQFAQLHIVSADTHSVEMDLAVDWRANVPSARLGCDRSLSGFEAPACAALRQAQGPAVSVAERGRSAGVCGPSAGSGTGRLRDRQAHSTRRGSRS